VLGFEESDKLCVGKAAELASLDCSVIRKIGGMDEVVVSLIASRSSWEDVISSQSPSSSLYRNL